MSSSKLGVAAAIGLPTAVVASLLMIILLVIAPGAAACGAGQGGQAAGRGQAASGVHDTSSMRRPRGFFISSASVRGG